MQLSYTFSALALSILAMANLGLTTPLAAPSADGTAAVATDEPASYLVSHEQMMHWIATTDAELTFTGKPINPLLPRSDQDTIVTYCTKRTAEVCGGTCRVYNGGATCIAAAGTQCLFATRNVGFCDRVGCQGNCTSLINCIVQLDEGFCYTPNTQSISVTTA